MSQTTASPHAPFEQEAVPRSLVAARHGLRPVRQRPGLGDYLVQLWERRHFAVALSTATVRSANSRDRLGSLWLVLSPFLLGAVYFVVFGVLLGADRGVANYVGFLTIGVFLYQFTAKSLTQGAKAITGNAALIRAVHFPRAVLPIVTSLQALLAVIPAVVVMLLFILLAPPDEALTWRWALVAPALLLQSVFNLGLAFVFARLTSHTRDVSNALPFVIRVWMYFSGVFYSLDRFVHHETVLAVLKANPLNIYLTLVREPVLNGVSAPLSLWAQGVGWALGMCVLGLLYFWHGEEEYGRE